MKRWRLNSIAARIAVTIVLAIILGITLEMVVSVSVNYLVSRYGARQDGADTHVFVNRFGIQSFNTRRSPPVISARIAAITRAVEQASPIERPYVITALTGPS